MTLKLQQSMITFFIIIGLALVSAKLTNKQHLINTNSGKEFLQQDVSSYNHEDFYLWVEGVTNLAYDDFLKTKFIKNIEYAGAGYKLPYANPQPTTGVDPGYSRYKAFKFNYSADKLAALTGDADYFVPEGFLMNSKTSCEVGFSSEEISTQSEYSSSLSASVSIGAEYGGFAFQASADYNQASEELAKKDTQFVESTANCMVYNVRVDQYNPPEWSDTLVAAFQNLLNNNKSENYFEFFETFGSHITVGVDLGSQFRYRFTMSSSDVSKMKTQGFGVDIGASGWGLEASLSTSYQKDSKEAFQNAMKSWSQFSIGAPPNSDNDALAWASEAASSPMPVFGSFISWVEFLDNYIPYNLPEEISGSDISTLRKGFQDSYKKYCSSYLLPNKIVQSCNGTFTAAAQPAKQPQKSIEQTFTCRQRQNVATKASNVGIATHYSGNKNSPLTDNINTRWQGTCWHAKNSKQNYYTVTLDKQYYINEIVIYGRTDCCQSRLQYIDVQIDGKTCYTNNYNPGNNPISTGGRCKGLTKQVTIKYNSYRGGDSYLTICGLKIYNCLN